MKVFLTGGTGYIGSAVLDALLRAGHQVTALVRDTERAERLARRGVQPVLGELAKPASYMAHAETCDGTIHTALEHSRRGDATDREALEALLPAVRRRTIGRSGGNGGAPFFIYTSGVWVIGRATRPAAEDVELDPVPHVAWRPEHERMVLEAGADGAVRTIVVRPGIVYGRSRGIIADLVKEAGNGLVRVIGTGKQHWPCVYDRDLADLYVRLASHKDASGVYHANDEADERVEEIVDAIAEHVRTRPDVRRVPIEEARLKLGPYADALALDQRIRSPRARALGWVPSLRSVAGNVARLLEEFRTAREAA
ncbi:MAG: NAD-dependent epimerase/dehydratase family protein [Acidimicrobiia bacterium]|nr:NAD-dependent epimerase/dehydratase family protein [Acidimicrobiia bacterium]